MELFPAYPFFSMLRTHPDFSLGVPEYECLLEVLKQDPERYLPSDDPDQHKLLNLCRLLWLKPNQSGLLFDRLFELSRQQTAVTQQGDYAPKPETAPTEADNTEANTPESIRESSKTPEIEKPKPENTPAPAASTSTTEAAIPKLYLNFQESTDAPRLSGGQQQERSFLFIQNYIPYQYRQLEQLWRSLKTGSGKKTATQEMDVPACIEALTQRGFLTDPIYRFEQAYTASLIVLMDCRGSMTAFKALCHAFADSAKRAGIAHSVFYFRNLPENMVIRGQEGRDWAVFRNMGLSDPIFLKTVLEQQPHTPVLILSDAGCAGGTYHSGRIRATREMLQLIYKHTRKVAWLNPMPQNRWDGSSAFDIRQMVDMYEANPAGLKQAIYHFTGKAQSKVKPLLESSTI